MSSLLKTKTSKWKTSSIGNKSSPQPSPPLHSQHCPIPRMSKLSPRVTAHKLINDSNRLPQHQEEAIVPNPASRAGAEMFRTQTRHLSGNDTILDSNSHK